MVMIAKTDMLKEVGTYKGTILITILYDIGTKSLDVCSKHINAKGAIVWRLDDYKPT
jgi:hypothetical protein